MSLIKNTSLRILLYFLAVSFIGLWGYWWMNLVLGFVVGYVFFEKPTKAFLWHFLLIFIYWFFLSILKDWQVDGAVSKFLSSLAGNLPPFLFYAITAFIGGFLTGWAAFLGSQLRKITTLRTH